MTRTGRRVLLASAVVVALAAGGLATYYTTDTRAKEARKAPKGPPAVPVTVAAAAQESVPIRVSAIGNVEAFLTVALKARVDGQIVAVNFREGQPVAKGEVLVVIGALIDLPAVVLLAGPERWRLQGLLTSVIVFWCGGRCARCSIVLAARGE